MHKGFVLPFFFLRACRCSACFLGKRACILTPLHFVELLYDEKIFYYDEGVVPVCGHHHAGVRFGSMADGEGKKMTIGERIDSLLNTFSRMPCGVCDGCSRRV